MLFLVTICITLLLSEALTHIKLMHTFRTVRYYVFKYLAVNSKNKTLETYLLKRFFPLYIALQIVCLAMIYGTSIFFYPYSIYIQITSLSIALLVRLYNRKIFSTLWTELKRIQ